MASTFVAIAPLISLLVAGEPLLVKADGNYKEGIVSVVSQAPKELNLKVQKGDAHALADFLKDKLVGAEIVQNGETIKIKGLAEHEALDKLAALEFDAIPALAMDSPEAGGSIRVGRTAEIPTDSTANEESERFKALVVGVTRGQFPDVTLKVKITGLPRSVDLQKRLKKNSYISGRVALAQTKDGPDLRNVLTQRNLLGTYLRAGDSVLLHVTETKEAKPSESYIIDFLERLP